MPKQKESDALKNKLAGAASQDPEEAAKMDAQIREEKPSVRARRLVAAIRACQARGLSPEAMAEELKAEKELLPRLYEMVTAPGHSEELLNAMLAQLEAVEGGRKTTHEASVHVGTMLVNSYVRPKLGMEPVPLPGSEPQSSRPSGSSKKD
jgi:hypothetical protein